MSGPRAYKPGDLEKIRQALALLLKARDLLVEAGADFAVAKVRRAIKSTEGAERHAEWRARRADQ